MMSSNYQTYKEIISITVLTLFVCKIFLGKGEKINIDASSIYDIKELAMVLGLSFVVALGYLYFMFFMLGIGFYIIETVIMG